MVKKCIICNNPAIYQIKNTSDYYCPDCAEENFADISILVKVEDEAKRLKALVDSKLGDFMQEGDEEEENSEEDEEEIKEKPSRKKSKKK